MAAGCLCLRSWGAECPLERAGLQNTSGHGRLAWDLTFTDFPELANQKWNKGARRRQRAQTQGDATGQKQSRACSGEESEAAPFEKELSCPSSPHPTPSHRTLTSWPSGEEALKVTLKTLLSGTKHMCHLARR